MTTKRSYLDEHTLQADRQLFDLKEEIAQLRPMPEDRERRGIALVKEHGLNIVLTVVKGGTSLGEQQPRGAATVQVLEGSLRVRMDGDESVLTPGMVVALDANVWREVTALEDSAILTTVSLEPEGG